MNRGARAALADSISGEPAKFYEVRRPLHSQDGPAEIHRAVGLIVRKGAADNVVGRSRTQVKRPAAIIGPDSRVRARDDVSPKDAVEVNDSAIKVTYRYPRPRPRPGRRSRTRQRSELFTKTLFMTVSVSPASSLIK